MSVVALDVGSKRIGVAIADPSQNFAIPLTVIERSDARADIARVKELLRLHDAREVVIGDPITLAGERGPAAHQIDRFVNRLAQTFDGTIHRIDERLTTAQATKTLLAADVSRSRRRSAVDKMAAALILETFLARRRNVGSS